jgi:hypothetical protein
VFTHGHGHEHCQDDPPRQEGEDAEDYRTRAHDARGETIAEGLCNIAEELPALAEHPDFGAFVRHVVERRMSKEGRFIRVHFTTGARVDLVPEGSIATGMRLGQGRKGKPDWKFVEPDLQELWDEFMASRKRRRRKRKGR